MAGSPQNQGCAARVGDIVRAIRAEGLERDTLVVFLTDNGCNLKSTCRNTPLRGGKGHLYEGEGSGNLACSRAFHGR